MYIKPIPSLKINFRFFKLKPNSRTLTLVIFRKMTFSFRDGNDFNMLCIKKRLVVDVCFQNMRRTYVELSYEMS